MAPSLVSEFPYLYTRAPCKSFSYVSKSSLQWKSRSCCRNQRLKLSMQSPGLTDGDPYEKTEKNMKTGNQLPIQPSVSPLPLPNAPTWLKWTLGSIMWLALPSWKKIRSIGDVVTKVDNAVEIIEKVAEVTEKIASDVAEGLPEGGLMRKAVEGMENASEDVLEKVEVIDNFIDKVEDWAEKLEVGNERIDQDKRGKKNA